MSTKIMNATIEPDSQSDTCVPAEQTEVNFKDNEAVTIFVQKAETTYQIPETVYRFSRVSLVWIVNLIMGMGLLIFAAFMLVGFHFSFLPAGFIPSLSDEAWQYARIGQFIACVLFTLWAASSVYSSVKGPSEVRHPIHTKRRQKLSEILLVLLDVLTGIGAVTVLYSFIAEITHSLPTIFSSEIRGTIESEGVVYILVRVVLLTYVTRSHNRTNKVNVVAMATEGYVRPQVLELSAPSTRFDQSSAKPEDVDVITLVAQEPATIIETEPVLTERTPEPANIEFTVGWHDDDEISVRGARPKLDKIGTLVVTAIDGVRLAKNITCPEARLRSVAVGLETTTGYSSSTYFVEVDPQVAASKSKINLEYLLEATGSRMVIIRNGDQLDAGRVLLVVTLENPTKTPDTIGNVLPLVCVGKTNLIVNITGALVARYGHEIDEPIDLLARGGGSIIKDKDNEISLPVRMFVGADRPLLITMDKDMVSHDDQIFLLTGMACSTLRYGSSNVDIDLEMPQIPEPGYRAEALMSETNKLVQARRARNGTKDLSCEEDAGTLSALWRELSERRRYCSEQGLASLLTAKTPDDAPGFRVVFIDSSHVGKRDLLSRIVLMAPGLRIMPILIDTTPNEDYAEIATLFNVHLTMGIRDSATSEQAVGSRLATHLESGIGLLIGQGTTPMYVYGIRCKAEKIAEFARGESLPKFPQLDLCMFGSTPRAYLINETTGERCTFLKGGEIVYETLLFVLALVDRSATREKVADILFPSRAQTSQKLLRERIYAIRKLYLKATGIELPEGARGKQILSTLLVTLDRHTITLNPNYVDGDYLRFYRLYKAAQEPGISLNMKVALLSEARDLYMVGGRTFLDACIDSLNNWEGLEKLRNTLIKDVRRLESDLAGYYIELEDYSSAIEVLTEIRDENPQDEEIARRLMLAYHQGGRNGEAYLVYRQLVDLYKESGIGQPAAATTELYEELSQGQTRRQATLARR